MSTELKNLPMAGDNQDPECCSTKDLTVEYTDPVNASWVRGSLETKAGLVCQIATTLDRQDLFGSVKARWGIGRMNYTIAPGLYAIGEPDHLSPVLVSANYKLSFDYLRRELGGLNLWILVLDTKGINVWCAAGKGSFGTAELIRMINQLQLEKLVSHRTLILPQLAAPGVSAHRVRKEIGYKVAYGPVRAADIPAFLSAGNKAKASMRHPRFNLVDRLTLTTVELTALFKPLAILTIFLFLLNLTSMTLKSAAASPVILLKNTFSDLAPFIIAALIGTILVPALLPYIPGRALAWKGWILGVIWAFVYTTIFAVPADWLQTTAYFLTLPIIPAFLGMNYTGSTTYTSLSGVVKEMTYALPLIIVSASLGLVALIGTYFI